MARLLHSLGAALDMARLQSLLLFVCLFVCFLGRHLGCKDEIGWRNADDAMEGSGVLVPEGIGGGSCAIHAAVHKRQDFVFNMHFNR